MSTTDVGIDVKISTHTISPNKAVSEARSAAHASGRSFSASEAKAVKSAAQASNEIKKEAVKGVEDGFVDAQGNAVGTISREIYEKIDDK